MKLFLAYSLFPPLRYACHRLVLVFFALVFFTPIVSYAQEQDLPKAAITRQNNQLFVRDEINLLSPQAKSSIQNALVAFSRYARVQIVVVIVADTQGEALADYALRLGRKWGVGKDNQGIVMLIAAKQRRLWISVGTHLEPYLSDITTKRIISQVITPAFKNADYYGGIRAGIIAMGATLAKTMDGDKQRSEARQFFTTLQANPNAFFTPIADVNAESSSAHLPNWLSILIGIVVFILIIVLLSRRGNNGGGRGGGRRGASAADALSMLAAGAFLLGGRGGGGGFGGGGERFGGGNFGGGGAGGSW